MFPPPKSPAGPPMGGPGPMGMGGPPPLLGANPPAPQAPAIPMGGSLPPAGADMGGSSLLAALASSLGGGDLAMTPGGDTDLQGLGPNDPNMGLEQLLTLLCLGKGGFGPPGMTPGAGSSGVPMDMGSAGQTLGF